MKTKSTGEQIQSLANLLCGLGWFVCFVIGIASFATGYIFMGIIVIAVCGYIVWAITRILQGFGEMVGNTEANRENTDRIIDLLESQFGNKQSEPKTNTTQSFWVCKKCGTANKVDTDSDVQFCKACGRQTRSWEEITQ